MLTNTGNTVEVVCQLEHTIDTRGCFTIQNPGSAGGKKNNQ